MRKFFLWLFGDDNGPNPPVNPPAAPAARPAALADDDDTILSRFTPTQLGRAIAKQTAGKGGPRGRPPGSRNKPKGGLDPIPGEKPVPAPTAAVAAALALLAGLLVVGCETDKVPTTKIRFGNVEAEFPKQFTGSNITFAASTNGEPMSFHADFIRSENDPSVIEQAGIADAHRIDSIFVGSAKLAGSVIEAGAKGASKQIVPFPLK